MMFCCQRYPESDAEALGKKMETIFDRDPQVQGYALGLVNAVEVGDVRGVTALGMESRKGSVTPSVVEGHLPTGPNEIIDDCFWISYNYQELSSKIARTGRLLALLGLPLSSNAEEWLRLRLLLRGGTRIARWR